MKRGRADARAEFWRVLAAEETGVCVCACVCVSRVRLESLRGVCECVCVSRGKT